jgi:multicomponent Na+:H+ antiporter subunit E
MKSLRRLGAWLALARMFLRDLLMSVKEVVLIVLWPGRAPSSGIVAVPLDVRSEGGVTLLANMITLTPGTTSLHVSEDRKVLYVHVMNLADDTVAQIKGGLEQRVRQVLP